MDKTVPSYRMALEFEIETWKPFRKALKSEDLEAFDQLMDICRRNAMAGGSACDPEVFQPRVLSILLAQQRKLEDIKYKLNEALWQCIQVGKQMKR